MNCCTLDSCITQYGVHYIGGRDPPRADGQEGGGQGDASSGGGTWGRQHP
jgi:hypothetical protein